MEIREQIRKDKEQKELNFIMKSTQQAVHRLRGKTQQTSRQREEIKPEHELFHNPETEGIEYLTQLTAAIKKREQQKKQEALEKMLSREKSHHVFKKEQSYFFNYVDRKNHFQNKMRATSSAETGPNCTRYKPKFSLIKPGTLTFDMASKSVQPSIIEEIILKKYKEFEQLMEGLSHYCTPLIRLENIKNQELNAIAER